MSNLIRTVLKENAPDNNLFFNLSQSDLRIIKNDLKNKYSEAEYLEIINGVVGIPEELKSAIRKLIELGENQSEIQKLLKKYIVLDNVRANKSLNLVLDFSDLPNVDEISFNSEADCPKEYFRQSLYKNYLTFKIFQEIQDNNLRCKNDWQACEYIDNSHLLPENQDDFIDETRESFNTMLSYLFLIGCENDSKIRIHLFLDPVEDSSLQEVINIMIESNFALINGYSSKEDLITRSLPLGDELAENSFVGYYKGPVYSKK